MKLETPYDPIHAFILLTTNWFLITTLYDDGSLFSLGKEQVDDIVKKLGNIAHNNLSHRVQIEHAIEPYNGENLLFVFIPEEQEKPVHLRGKDIYASYYRLLMARLPVTTSFIRERLSSLSLSTLVPIFSMIASILRHFSSR